MIFILFFLSLMLVVATSAIIIQRKKGNYVKRIERFLPNKSQKTGTRAETEEQDVEKGLRMLLRNLSAKFVGKGNVKKMSRQLEGANIAMRAEEFLTIRLLFFIGTIFLFLIAKTPYVITLLFAIVTSYLPVLYVRSKLNKRLNNFTMQLPQAIGTMSSAMRSGYSFMQAMNLVAKEMPDPIGPEFKKAVREINIGIQIDTAFDNLLERIPNDDLRLVVTAVVIQRTTGGNLAQILETIQETIVERVRIQEELQALTSQGRMSAYIITLLPFVLALILNIMNPNYFEPMFSHPLGLTMLIIGLISGIMGWIVIQKIIRIEV